MLLGMGDQGNQELQTQTSCIPTTPIKPISLQGSEVHLEPLSESDEFPPGPAPNTRSSVLGLSMYSETSFSTSTKRRLDDFAVGCFSGQSTSGEGGTLGVAEDLIDLRAPKPPKGSCRKALNFDIEEQQREQTVVSLSASVSKLHVRDLQETGSVRAKLSELAREFQGFVENGKKSEHHRSMIPTGEGCMTPEGQDISVAFPTQTNHYTKKLEAAFTGTITGGKGNSSDNECKTIADIMSGVNSKAREGLAADNNCGTSTILPLGEANRSTGELYPNEHVSYGGANLSGVKYNSLEAYTRVSWIHFPITRKKKRTEEAHHGILSFIRDKEVRRYVRMPCQILERTRALTPDVTDRCSIPQTSPYGCLQEFGQRDKLTGKRSRGLTRVRDLASLNRILECPKRPLYSTNEPADGSSQKPDSCVEALLAEIQTKLSRKKRTKKELSLVCSGYAGTLQQQSHRSVMSCNYWKSSINSSGCQTGLPWKQVLSIDAIVQQLQQLDIATDAIVQQLEQLDISTERDGFTNPPAYHETSDREPKNKLHSAEEGGSAAIIDESDVHLLEMEYDGPPITAVCNRKNKSKGQQMEDAEDRA